MSHANRILCGGSLLVAILFVVPVNAADLTYRVVSGNYPDPSSVSATIDAGLLVGRATDDSSLSGSGAVYIEPISAPFQKAQIKEIYLELDDQVDFSLLFGQIKAEARPGETQVTLIEPGPAGDVINGKFDQLGNLFAFEGQVWLTLQQNEPEPFDLSSVAPVSADLLGIELIDMGSEIQSLLNFDLEYETTIETEGLNIPITIQIAGGVLARANKTIQGDFNQNSTLDAEDIDLLSRAVLDGSDEPMFDVNGDSLVDENDRIYWVKTLAWTYFGDANLDGQFNTADFVEVLAAGEYEDLQAGNSGWATGDWNGDTEFGTGDLVTALSDGGYEVGPIPRVLAIPEPSSVVLFLAGLIALLGGRRFQHSTLVPPRP